MRSSGSERAQAHDIGGDFDSPVGEGAIGIVEGKNVALGNATFLRSRNVETSTLEPEAERLRAEGATVINMAIDGKLAGILAIADPIKSSTPEVLKALASEGIRVIMLTGDNRTTAQAVARKFSIADVEAEVLPDQKSAVAAKLQKQGRIVAMAGEGVNDAPALGPAPTWRWKAPASPCSRATSPVSSAHAFCRRRR